MAAETRLAHAPAAAALLDLALAAYVYTPLHTLPSGKVYANAHVSV